MTMSTRIIDGDSIFDDAIEECEDKLVTVENEQRSYGRRIAGYDSHMQAATELREFFMIIANIFRIWHGRVEL